MKVQELLPSSKPSPASRAARSVPPEGRPFDFAGALTEARHRKQDAKLAEPDAPAAKKSAAARKTRETNDEPAPADDEIAPAASTPADKAKTTATADEDEPVSDADDSAATNDDEATAEQELLQVDADLSAIAMNQPMGPQTLMESKAVVDAEATDAGRRGSGLPKLHESLAQAQPKATDGDAGSDLAGVPLDLDDLGSADGVDELASALDDVAPERDPAPAKNASAKQSAAPVNGDDAREPEPKPKSADDQRQPPTLANDPAMTADASMEKTGSAPAAQGASNATIPASTTTAHVQPESAKPQATPAAPAAPAPLPPQAHFAEANHPTLVTAIQTQALTNGGSMQIRLDPPELGALQVMVNMKDGVMTASFQTSNDDATRLLSHSLSQLKQVLESQGVSVEKLQVQQSPKDQQPGNRGDEGQHQRDQQGDAHRQEQQRKEMLRRMWRRMANGSDPLDLVA